MVILSKPASARSSRAHGAFATFAALCALASSPAFAAPDAQPGAAGKASDASSLRQTRVETASAGLDLGIPTGEAESDVHSTLTLGLTGELMLGTRHVTAGGFLRWGLGGLVDVEPRTDNGLFRTGPRLRVGTALDSSMPSVFVTSSAGFGLAYARELRSRTDPTDPDAREVVDGAAYWQLFAAPGAGVLVPFGREPRNWHVTLGVNYYFTYWLQREARDLPLSPGWVEISVLIGSLRLPN